MNILVQNYLTRGFWGDEAWTALISKLPMGEIIRVTGQDFHPPFYYLLVHGFMGIFGESEWIRLISVMFFLLTPLAVYRLVKGLVSRNLAVLAGILVGLSPILFTYAFEARAYALLAWLSVMAAVMFWEKKWLGYFVVGAVGVYTHYYMWFILASQGIYWLVFDRKQFLKMVGVFGGILLVQLPWLPTLLSQVTSVASDYWIAPIDKRTHWEWFVRVTGGDFETPQRGVGVWLILVLMVTSLIVVKIREKKYPQGYKFLWMWLVVPVVLPSLISLYRPAFFYRYLIFSSIPILVIGLWGLYAVKDWLAWGGGAFLVAVYLSINVLGVQRYPYTMREELNKALIEKKVKVVTVLPAFAEVMYYTKGRVEVEVLPEGLVQFSGKSLLDAYVRQGKVKIAEAQDNQDYWLVEPGPKSSYYAGE